MVRDALLRSAPHHEAGVVQRLGVSDCGEGYAPKLTTAFSYCPAPI
jgi:hypothetical protein